jgi:antitoxin YobK
MTIEHYISARKLLLEGDHELDIDKPLPARPELIRKAEQALGVIFPPSYRQFLTDFGSGGFGSLEVYGILGADFKNSGIPDGIWYTLKKRQDHNVELARKYVIIEHGGDGTCVAIDTSRRDIDGECPLVRIGLDGEPVEPVSDSFGSWLLDEVTWRIDSRA